MKNCVIMKDCSAAQSTLTTTDPNKGLIIMILIVFAEKKEQL